MGSPFFKIAVFISTLSISALVASSPTETIRSEKNKISIKASFPAFQALDEGGKIRVEMEGLLNTIEAGKPSVPVKTLKIALPAGKVLSNVTSSGEGRTTLRQKVTLNQSMHPISWATNPPNEKSRGLAPQIEGARYPASSLEYDVQVLHGVPVVVMNLYPITVSASLDEAEAFEGFSVQLELSDTRNETVGLADHQRDSLLSFIDNPEALSTYFSRQMADAYDYLILTSQTYAAYTGENGFKAFQEYLTSKNLKSKVVDVAQIQSTGTDKVEKIRNFIANEYKAAAIQYVLFAGSTADLPTRSLNSKIKAYFGNGWVDLEESIPSDFYYAALDGSFDGNKNGKWGETTDGTSGADVDFLPEVITGRVTLRSVDDLKNFVSKTLHVNKTAAPSDALLMGEVLFPEKKLTGGDYMDQLLGKVTEHGYTTEGYGTSWKIGRLYDSSSGEWTGAQALKEISTKTYSMVNHLGHSNANSNMRLSSSFGFPKFENTFPFFYYTQGCFAGTLSGSFVTKLVNYTKGAVAAVGNSTYGLAPEDPQPETTKTPGASHMLHRKFVHAVFTGGVKSLGEANEYSKKEYLGLKMAQEIRWVTFGAHYFGDPSLMLKY